MRFLHSLVALPSTTQVLTASFYYQPVVPTNSWVLINWLSAAVLTYLWAKWESGYQPGSTGNVGHN